MPPACETHGSSAAENDPASDLLAHGDPQPLPRLTEAQLAALWRGRRFPEGALVTRGGVPVRVVHQGRPGRGPGPDFRGAVIAGPSGLTLRGDVELHVRSSSFRAHGHAADPAYAGVVLHVVFDDDTGADTPLPGGGTAPVVALAPWVARRAGELERWLERPPLWREPCHDAVARLGAEGAGATLDAEGDRRLAAHAARYAEEAAADGIGQALYAGLLEALGYGGNSTPMRALARALPWRALRAGGERAPRRGIARRQAFEALLLGAAGLLPSQRGRAVPPDAYVEPLERTFAASGLAAMPAAAWKLWGVRPANAPARRLAAAAALLDALGEPSALLRVPGAATAGEALRPLSAVAEGYWRTHFDPCAGPCRLPPALVGRSRALEILVNVVLPAAVAGGDAARARALYARLPRPASYGATRFLEGALASGGGRVPLDTRRAQGLLALHHDWCTQGGCGRCPLSEGREGEGRRSEGEGGRR
ncbi:MAG: DUF2851 family protein [Chloroflexota bacterium]|nr:DUF2851 family protein [Chloroflexota bacterium]